MGKSRFPPNKLLYINSWSEYLCRLATLYLNKNNNGPLGNLRFLPIFFFTKIFKRKVRLETASQIIHILSFFQLEVSFAENVVQFLLFRPYSSCRGARLTCGLGLWKVQVAMQYRIACKLQSMLTFPACFSHFAWHVVLFTIWGEQNKDLYCTCTVSSTVCSANKNWKQR